MYNANTGRLGDLFKTTTDAAGYGQNISGGLGAALTGATAVSGMNNEANRGWGNFLGGMVTKNPDGSFKATDGALKQIYDWFGSQP